MYISNSSKQSIYNRLSLPSRIKDEHTLSEDVFHGLVQNCVVLRLSASAEHGASVAEIQTAWWSHSVTTAALAPRYGRAQYYTILQNYARLLLIRLRVHFCCPL